MKETSIAPGGVSGLGFHLLLELLGQIAFVRLLKELHAGIYVGVVVQLVLIEVQAGLMGLPEARLSRWSPLTVTLMTFTSGLSRYGSEVPESLPRWVTSEDTFLDSG